MSFIRNDPTLNRARERALLLGRIRERRQIYLLLVPPLAYLLIFSYGPMAELVIAFKRYTFVIRKRTDFS
jgi:putative aldouronate transport system permease protein